MVRADIIEKELFKNPRSLNGIDFGGGWADWLGWLWWGGEGLRWGAENVIGGRHISVTINHNVF